MHLAKSILTTATVISGLVAVTSAGTSVHAAEYAATLPAGAQVKREAPTWGRVVKGLQLGISLDYLKRPYRIGEVAAFTLTVRNVSKQPVTIRHAKPDWLIKPDVTDEKGNALSFSQQALLFGPAYNLPVNMVTTVVAPKQSVEIGNARLTIGANPQEKDNPVLAVAPGKYQVRYSYEFQPGPVEPKPGNPRAWAGRLTSGMIMLQVAPALGR